MRAALTAGSERTNPYHSRLRPVAQCQGVVSAEAASAGRAGGGGGGEASVPIARDEAGTVPGKDIGVSPSCASSITSRQILAGRVPPATRFMGLIVIAMGVQFALTGVRAFMKG